MKSDFFITSVEESAVYLIDADRGRMSVTNDAENVVAYINKLHPNKRIFYKDSEKQWSELIHKEGNFVGYAPYAS
jgi:hypothetical protein